MRDSIEEKYIKKAKAFRLGLKLSEGDIDNLLKEKKLLYTKLESGKRTLTLELAEAFTLIFGMNYCEFRKEETCLPNFLSLPKSTQDYINNKSNIDKNTVGVKGTKNKASYIVIAIKDFMIGDSFTNSDILSKLPDPLNQEFSIDWNKGLLKGLVKNTKRSKTYKNQNGEFKREAIYEIIKEVDVELIKKADKNL